MIYIISIFYINYNNYIISTYNSKNDNDNYRWRWQVDGGPTALDVRVSPDWQTGADRCASGWRGTWRRYTDFRRVQHVVGQPAIRKRTDNAQEVAVGTGRRTTKPPATCWTRKRKSALIFVNIIIITLYSRLWRL